MQSCRIVAGNRAMIRVNDGFEKAHNYFFDSLVLSSEPS
jgi:hypothetical protein